jgi:hypothetical protein
MRGTQRLQAVHFLADTTTYDVFDAGAQIVKKGRHRRFEEARALKRITLETAATPCDECGAGADEKCASWCLARVPEDDLDDEAFELDDAPNEAANY